MNKQLRGNFKYLRFRQCAVCQLLLLLLQTSRTNCKTWLGAVFGPPSPPSCQYWRVGKGAGALDLESTAEHDILSNGSDHYLQSFVRVPVIHVRRAKQGWFSFLVEGIVNPERFLLLFSRSFLIKHTHTVGVASPPVSFSVKWDCGASGETETYLLGLFLFASKVRPTVRLLSCVSSCIRRGLTSAGAKLFASLLAAVMGH